MSLLPASLEDLISAKLATLGLAHDEGTVSFIEGVIQEDSFEDEDRKGAILGMLELEEGDAAVDGGLSDLLIEVKGYQEREEALKNEQQAATAARKQQDELASRAKKVLTSEEEEARRKNLVKAYEFMEEEDEQERVAKLEAEKVPTAVFIDPKLQTKKARKKAEAGVDILMQPNLNAAIVRGAELQRRQEDAARAAAKREKDKSDQRKQKEDALKAAEAKKKKAAKVERRA